MKNIVNKVIICLILLIFIVFLGAYYVYTTQLHKNVDLFNEKESMTQTKVKPEETEHLDDFKMELVDYRIYKINKLPFQFVIARLRITTKDTSSNISLSKFRTSEDIILNDVESYVKQLEENSFYLGKQNVVFSLVSDQQQYFANIFIPVKDKESKTVTLYNAFNDESIQFNLNDKLGNTSQLIYKADDIISDGKTYQMKVSQAFSITGIPLYEMINGQEFDYLLPSTVEVYNFVVEAVSLWGDEIVIEKATYKTDKDEFIALEKNIFAEKYSNILGKTITEKDSGSLFFIAYNPIENPVTYKGVLQLQLKGSDTVINVEVNLN